MKKLLAFLLVFCMVFTMLPAAAAAEAAEIASGTCGDNVTWRLTESNWLYISGSGRMDDFAEGGAPWDDYKATVYAITIEGEITYIGDYAFDGMTGLCMITFNNSLTEIGDYAFRNCSNLYALHRMPDTIVTIGDGAFQYCASLSGAWTNSVESIGNSAFEGTRCSSANLPMSVKTVGERAFADCPELREAKFHANVTSIGAEAFSGCTVLEEIIFNGEAPAIGENAFAGATATVFYVESYTSWTEQAKQNYGGTLTYVSISSPIVVRRDCGQGDDKVMWTLLEDGTMIISGSGRMDDFNSYGRDENGNTVFTIYWDDYFDRIKTLIVEEGVTYIGDHAFLGASELTTVILPDSLTEIGDQVFPGCGKLESVTFGAGLTETGIEVFRNCEALTEITLPQGDVDYGNGVFSGCINLSSVTIPNTQTTIGETMFRNCKALTQIEIPEGITHIGSRAFEGSGLTSIEIPATVTSMNRGVFENCDSLTEVEIPGSVSTIPYELFKNCDNLTKVTFNEGTTEMSYGILANCPNVAEITIPSTVTKMVRTFEYANGLKKVTFTGNAPDMGSDLFYGITLTAYYPAGNATWTAEVMQNYGGTITWESYYSLGTPEITGKLSGSKAIISWEAVDGAEKYEVWRATSENGTYRKLITTTKLTCTNTPAAGTYYYKVRAVDSDGQISEFSNVVSVTVYDSVPKITGKLNSSNKAVITWGPVKDAVKYEVYRSTSGKTGTFRRLITTTKLSCINTPAAGTYYYKVRAVKEDGTKTVFSNVVSVTVYDAIPKITGKLSSNNKAVITWGPVKDAVKYEVYRSTSGKTGTFRRLITTTKLSCINTPAAGTYYYKVRAIKEDGTKTSFSNVVSVTVYDAVPKITGKVNSNNKVVITWGPVKDAVKYEVWRSRSENGNYWRLIVTTKLNCINSVGPGTYYYHVRAVMEDGTKTEPSNIVCVTVESEG